jgi:hypothetical protein
MTPNPSNLKQKDIDKLTVSESEVTQLDSLHGFDLVGFGYMSAHL